MNYYNPFNDKSLVKKTTLVDGNGKKSTGYYDTAKQAYAQLLENAQKQNAALADAEIADIGAEAQRSGTGLWSTYQQQMRKAPQQLAALGITGGAAESSVVGAGNNYLQQIAELDRQRKQQEADIRLNRDTNNSNAYQTYMNNLLALDQYNQDYQLQLSQLELQKRQMEQQQRQAEAEMELAWAKFEAANSKKSGGGSGGKPYTPPGDDQTQDDQMEKVRKDIINAAVEDANRIAKIANPEKRVEEEKNAKDTLDNMFANGQIDAKTYTYGIEALGGTLRRATN